MKETHGDDDFDVLIDDSSGYEYDFKDVSINYYEDGSKYILLE